MRTPEHFLAPRGTTVMARAMSFHAFGLLLVFALCLRAGPARAGDGESLVRLRQEFAEPPDSSRPWVYWFWLDGNVTRAGITADLEAMHRVGIGGVFLFDVTHEVPPGPVRFGTPDWFELFRHTLAEARRLGLQVSVHNAAGFTGSGGPWITPDLAMRKVVSSRTNLAGPLRFSALLPRLPADHQPIATLAFPAVVGDGAPLRGFKPGLSSSASGRLNPALVLDGNRKTVVELPLPTARRAQHLQLEFSSPYAASLLRLTGTAPQAFQGTLLVSEDGRRFRKLREFASVRSGLNLAFPLVSSKYYRISFTGAEAAAGKLAFTEVELSPQYSIPLYQTKSGLGILPDSALFAPDVPEVPAEAIIDPAAVLDLSGQTGGDGRLEWDVPPGNWTILRLAHVPVGTVNHPAPPEGEGLECDKLSREAVEAHFNAFLGRLIAEAGEGAGTVLTGLHVDSWEIGFQNWTPRFPEQFLQRRGYSMLPWLPALSGRYVGSAEQSERFLWDVRRTIAELVADHYAGHLAGLAAEHGLRLSLQGYGSLGSGPYDELVYASRAGLPMTEFWLAGHRQSLDLHRVASVGHAWGKPVIAAEAFTSYPQYSAWREHPGALKPLGDTALCEGVNLLAVHRYAHQPWNDLRPGMTMGPWGLHYERTQTWWEQSQPWHDYLARCQHLLRTGSFVADVAYLTREGSFTAAPSRPELHPRCPPGYDYDVLTPEVVLQRMSVRDGRLVLPDGMSYSLLVLPPGNLMTPVLLRRIADLVAAGATVVGPRPVKSPSLSGYPACDSEVEALAAALWGPCDGQKVKEHQHGQGQIAWGRSLSDELMRLRVPPDFVASGLPEGHALHWIHRRVGNTELFFVANPNPRPATAECRFRISGKTPEFWFPDSGTIRRPAVWRTDEHYTLVPISLPPSASVFVAFTPAAEPADPVLQVTRNGVMDSRPEIWFRSDSGLELVAEHPGLYEARTRAGQTLRAEVDSLPAPQVLTGPWRVTFPPNLGAPARLTLESLVSWSTHPDPGVKYFSGSATYSRTLNIQEEWLGAGRSVYLELGRVEVVAEVAVNGHPCAVLWKPPFQVDVTDAVRPGENALEIKVTSLWPNRLIGDEHLPEDCKWGETTPQGAALLEWPQWLREGRPRPTARVTFATRKHWTRDDPLLDSGLLGPVRIGVRVRRPMN